MNSTATPTRPIELNIKFLLWENCTDNSGNKYSQLTVDDTPRALYKFIPIKEKGYINMPHYVVNIKEIELMFKRKKYILQFLRTVKYCPK